MRDILFRGIWVHGNKEWIEGDLVRDSEGKPHIVDSKYVDYWHGEPIFVCEDECEVIPETVGQYTGLTDKNGKKVFEGDIISFGLRFCAVKYDMENARYMFYENGRHKLDGFNCETMKLKEVIGNVFDNPELLEVK